MPRLHVFQTFLASMFECIGVQHLYTTFSASSEGLLKYLQCHVPVALLNSGGFVAVSC